MPFRPVRAPVQAALERSLAAQLRTAVAQPLQDGFRASFQATLLPAFESACQTMFSQVGPDRSDRALHQAHLAASVMHSDYALHQSSLAASVNRSYHVLHQLYLNAIAASSSAGILAEAHARSGNRGLFYAIACCQVEV